MACIFNECFTTHWTRLDKTYHAENEWSLKEEGEIITNETEIAEVFNEFFITEIQDLKGNIDPNGVEDPEEKLKEKLEGKDLHFSLESVNVEKVKKSFNVWMFP